MKKKVTLKIIGNFFRDNVTISAGWVTYDMAGVRVFDNKGGASNPPRYNKDLHLWTSVANTLLSTISIPKRYISLRDYCGDDTSVDYSKCIECIDPVLSGTLTEGKKKYTYNKKGVLAYFTDGSTILFDCKEEAKEFFGFKRIDQVTRYIKSGLPLSDGTTLDEAID